MPLEVNMLMDFLGQVEDARRRRQQEAQEQAPAAPEMPEWSKRLNPDDFKGATRDMLLKAQAAAPGTANQMGKGDLDLMPQPLSDSQRVVQDAYNQGMRGMRSPQQSAPSPDIAVREGINQVMEEERQRQPMPAPMDPGVMRDPNRPPQPLQQPVQPPMPEPAAQMPQQQKPTEAIAPAAFQGAPSAQRQVNLRKALGPHVGDGGDYMAMAQRARQTGELPGGSDFGWAPGDAPSERNKNARAMMAQHATARGGGGSDTLAGGSAPSRASGGGLFGGSGPGLGYAIGGIGALLQEAGGQQGAASRFAQTYGERYQQQRMSNQTRQLALQLGIPEEIVANAPMNLLTPMIADTWKRRNAGTEYQYVETPEGIVQIDPATGETRLVHESAQQPGKWNDVVLEFPDGTKRGFNTGTPEGYAAANQAINEGAVPVKTPATQVNIGTGDQTAGQKKADEAFGDEYQSWVTGGFADVQSQLGKLDEVTAALESGAELSGPAIGIAFKRLPPDVFAAQYPEAQAALDTASEVIQRTLRETLGAQFTETEAERFIARSYNMSLPPQENARRMRQAADTLRRQVATKDAAVKHFGEHGSLTGFDYQSVPAGQAGQQTTPPAAGHGGQQQDVPPEGVDPEDWKYMTPEQRALWQ